MKRTVFKQGKSQAMNDSSISKPPATLQSQLIEKKMRSISICLQHFHNLCKYENESKLQNLYFKCFSWWLLGRLRSLDSFE